MSPREGADDLLIVAGEASGDSHAADLLEILRFRRPAVRPFGLGGDRLAAAGLERLADSSEISVVGITEVLKVLPRARQIFNLLLAEVDRRGARTALLVDFPDFNLRLAKALKRRGVRVVYYVSPQVWAWRRGRIKTIERVVDQMLVLFPFEQEFYRKHGVAATHVGHPVVDQVPEVARSQRAPSAPRRICLLPGSRRSEIRKHLAVMSDAAALLAGEMELEVSWIVASEIDPDEFAGLLPPELTIEQVTTNRFEVIARADLALCASGTATLEVGLLATPMVVIYRVSRLTGWLGRALIRLPFISLVNLVFGRLLVPELLQGDANAAGIASCAGELLRDRERLQTISRELATLRGRLGTGGASERAAEVVDGELDR